ncbi:RabGAP/TBC [Panus rudis PR-1116 ss-1]|nr:RabGAP/TBC [Panus rudis PR-1116 ss-1]
MDSPSLVVVPPTPIRDVNALRTPQPSPTTTNQSSLPDLSPSTTDRERSSSETTIFTIYSMYGEDEDERRSWSASERLSVAGHRHRFSKDVDIVTVAQVPDPRPESYIHNTNGRVIAGVDQDSAFYDATSGKYRPSSTRLSTVDRIRGMRQSAASADSAQLAYTDSRPSSSYVRTSTLTGDSSAQQSNEFLRTNVFSQDYDTLAVSPPSSRPPSAFHPPEESSQRRSHTLSPDLRTHTPPHSRPTSRPHSRPNSQYQQSNSSQRGYSTPNGGSSLQTSSPASVSKPLPASPAGSSTHPLPPPALSPARSSTPVNAVASPSILAPVTPPSSQPDRQSANGSPGSIFSLQPSEGEDPDAFHVRSTYAQLDQQGVKGDGYVEGVERTRAKLGGRASEIRALEALADASEKTRDLTPKEVEVLGSLDRYGFFVIPSHDRLLSLPSSPLRKPLSRVTTASAGSSANASVLRSQPPVKPPTKETIRIAKWNRMLEAASRDEGGNVVEWIIRPSKERKLKARTFKGIPDCWRSAAWQILMNRYSMSGQLQLRQLAETYREALDKPSTYDIQIDLDVPRTITGHIMFRTRYGQGQRSLFHVLHCLSLHCAECGYCQGMGPIAATLLCYFEPERAYASLVRLHDNYRMHTIFSPGFPGLLEAIYVQERITEQMMPVVYAAFKKHMISTTSYATKWYITLFANSVPFQTQLRLWDVFLLEGPDIFVIVAVAVVWVYRDHITSDAANFESVLSLLSSFFVPEDEDALLSWIEKAISDKKLRSSMQQWRQDWQRLVSRGLGDVYRLTCQPSAIRTYDNRVPSPCQAITVTSIPYVYAGLPVDHNRLSIAIARMSSYFPSQPPSPVSGFFPTGPASPNAFALFGQSPGAAHDLVAALGSMRSSSNTGSQPKRKSSRTALKMFAAKK